MAVQTGSCIDILLHVLCFCSRPYRLHSMSVMPTFAGAYFNRKQYGDTQTESSNFVVSGTVGNKIPNHIPVFGIAKVIERNPIISRLREVPRIRCRPSKPEPVVVSAFYCMFHMSRCRPRRDLIPTAAPTISETFSSVNTTLTSGLYTAILENGVGGHVIGKESPISVGRSRKSLGNIWMFFEIWNFDSVTATTVTRQFYGWFQFCRHFYCRPCNSFRFTICSSCRVGPITFLIDIVKMTSTSVEHLSSCTHFWDHFTPSPNYTLR